MTTKRVLMAKKRAQLAKKRSGSSQKPGTAVGSDATAYNLAANLFWRLALTAGVEKAKQSVIETRGWCLFNQSFTADVMKEMGWLKFSDARREALLEEVTKGATVNCVHGETIAGEIKDEDARAGRSPSAANLDTAVLKCLPATVRVTGAPVEKMGELCLRHPLPAVVFSESEPKSSLIEVMDTSKALGYRLPLFLTVDCSHQVNGELFALTGTFAIPVPGNGNGWDRVIQNAKLFQQDMHASHLAGWSIAHVTW